MLSSNMQNCIDTCQECHETCEDILFNHCLKMGGKHAEQNHVRMMVDCIQICQASADFMLRNSNLHTSTCRACADICEACAESCEKVGGKEMQACAEICRSCAKICREISQMKQAA